MIPKKIHYCWFGYGEKTKLVQKCIGSWKTYCPDYEIIEWNENNFNIEKNAYTKMCYKEKKYAFLTDYIRLLVVAKYGGSITEYEGGGKVPGDIIPLIAIPTTAGTGSEVTAFSVITDHSRNYKLTVFSYKLIPSYAILDPELLTTAPVSVAAACGIDAMVHALEAYISKDSSPFTDAMAEKALELIGKNIRKYVADRSDIQAAENMLMGSLFAGIAFSWARLGDVHAMSHPVSAFFNVPHGVANAILLPTIVEYNALADNGKYLKIYNYISRTPVLENEFEPLMLVELLKNLNAQLGIPASLSEVGVTADKFDAMADDAMKSGNIAVNPRSTTKKDVLSLYEKAL